MFNSDLSRFALKEDFVKRYKRKKVNWDDLGYVTYKRTYARKKAKNQSEEWADTVRRVVEGVYTLQKSHCKTNGLYWNERKAQNSAEKMYDLIFNFKFTPPGRGLWMMGTDYVLERGGAALNNCFSGNTKFYTDKGTVRFKDVVNQTINVLANDNNYHKATVRNYGKQKLQKIIMKPSGLRSNYFIEYDVTNNHRWILSDGTETTNLSVGDKIITQERIFEIDDDFNTGFAHGLIFGDRTRNTYYPERHFIRLCTENREELANKLSKSGGYVSTTNPKSFGDDLVVTIIRKDENWKELPKNKSDSYLNGFIKGWIEADGWKKPSGSICLDTQNSIAADWLMKEGGRAGYYVTGYSVDNRNTNYGSRKTPLNRISIVNKPQEYTVTEIIPLSEEDVYCVEEPVTSTFTLESGVLTGNCAFVSTENITQDLAEPFCFLMDMSMLGVGVGGDTKGAEKLTVKEPKQNEETYVVPDTREGWVELLRTLLNAYSGSGELPKEIDYSQVRELGAPIKGFGGVSSGPEPLKALYNDVKKLLDERIGDKITSSDIVDIFNIIGRCVVSGNVRRSAEIMFGEPNDKKFLELKDPEKYEKELMSHRWASNNSIFAKVGMDYSEVAERTAKNGEPGYEWLDNARAYSRMNGEPDHKDYRAAGGNPCLEQTLESYELCCLVETYPGNHDSLEEWIETLKYAYLYAKSVTLLKTHNSKTNQVMTRNRRIGCSMSGITQAFNKFGRRKFFEATSNGYEAIQKWDKNYSEWLGIPNSIKTTSVKPSGTVSLLAGCTPGIHYPYSEYYLKNMRISKISDLIPPLREAGYPINEDPYDKSSYVVSFPVKIENFDRGIADVTMWEQLENVAQIQEYWADNQVSVTVTFKPEEADQIKHALELYETRLKGVSFLPYSNHSYKLAPYEPIDEKEYSKVMSKISGIKRLKMDTHEKTEKFCDSDSCTI